jgi:hypothetical protein
LGIGIRYVDLNTLAIGLSLSKPIECNAPQKLDRWLS